MLDVFALNLRDRTATVRSFPFHYLIMYLSIARCLNNPHFLFIFLGWQLQLVDFSTILIPNHVYTVSFIGDGCHREAGSLISLDINGLDLVALLLTVHVLLWFSGRAGALIGDISSLMLNYITLARSLYLKDIPRFLSIMDF